MFSLSLLADCGCSSKQNFEMEDLKATEINPQFWSGYHSRYPYYV